MSHFTITLIAVPSDMEATAYAFGLVDSEGTLVPGVEHHGQIGLMRPRAIWSKEPVFPDEGPPINGATLRNECLYRLHIQPGKGYRPPQATMLGLLRAARSDAETSALLQETPTVKRTKAQRLRALTAAKGLSVVYMFKELWLAMGDDEVFDGWTEAVPTNAPLKVFGGLKLVV